MLDASLKTSPNPAAARAGCRIAQFKIYDQKAGVKTDLRTFKTCFYAGYALRGGLALGARGWTRAATNSLSFTARLVLFCRHRCLKSALPPDVPIPERLAHCRPPECALLHAELQSRHSSLRSAPGKWRFGFLSLLSRHIYCSWFTGLRREYSNNCSNVNRYPGTHVQ